MIECRPAGGTNFTNASTQSFSFSLPASVPNSSFAFALSPANHRWWAYRNASVPSVGFASVAAFRSATSAANRLG